MIEYASLTIRGKRLVEVSFYQYTPSQRVLVASYGVRSGVTRVLGLLEKARKQDTKVYIHPVYAPKDNSVSYFIFMEPPMLVYSFLDVLKDAYPEGFQS